MSNNGKKTTTDEASSAKENEDRARRILVALHPVVQRLLPVLREMNRLNNNNNTASAQPKANHQPRNDQNQFQPLLRVLHELLAQYTHCLNQALGGDRTTTRLPQSDAKLRSTLLEYCLQPCLAAFKILLESSSSAENDNTSTRQEEDSKVPDAVRRKIWIETSRIMLQLLQTFADSCTVEKRLQVVQNLVATLPPLTKGPTLENNVETRQVYFDVLCQIWVMDDKKLASTGSAPAVSKDQKALTQALMEAWPQSALVARVAETCLESTQSPDTSAIASLKCLAWWIAQMTPQPQLWQRLFPGIFHALYRIATTAVRDFRQVTVAQSALEALTGLCRAVAVDENDDSPISKESGQAVSKVLKAMQAWKLSATPNETKSPSDSSMASGGENDNKVVSSTLFWTRVGQNLAIPIQRLLKQGSSHDSGKVRIATLRLACELQRVLQTRLGPILQQMEPSNRESWDNVHNTILDASIRMREDSDKNVQICVQNIKQSCASDRLLAGRVFERWRSIWDDVVGLTLGQQWVEWRSSLQLLQGYLAFVNRRDLQLFLKSDEKATRFLITIWTVDLPALNIKWRNGSVLTKDLITLPWKYLDRERLSNITCFTRKICEKVGARSAAVLVDDIATRCAEDLASSFRKDKLMELVALLQFSSGMVQRLDSSMNKASQAVNMLLMSTLPVVIDILSRVDRMAQEQSKETKHTVCFDVSLLQFLDAFVRLSPLQSSMQSECLFQVFLRHSCSEWFAVRDAADSCIESMNKRRDPSTGTREGLVAESLASMLGLTLARLRTDQGSEELRKTIQTTAAFLRLGCPSFGAEDNNNIGTIVAQTKEVLMVAVNRFDRWAVYVAKEPEMTLAFVAFFETVLFCLGIYLNTCSDTVEWGDATPEPFVNENHFLGLLDEFRNDTGSNTNEHTITAEDEDATRQTGQTSPFATKQDTDLVARIVSIATYLLSHPELRVQSASCELLKTCFALLLGVSKLPEPRAVEEELNGAKNAILRHIADCWPSLAARSNAIAGTLRNASQSTSLVIATPVVIDRSVAVNVGEMRVFLSRVFRLVAEMVEASDDFMASRIRETVWPLADHVISDAVKEKPADACTLQPSSSILLESALECIHRIYRHRPTGVALMGLIPTVGSRVLLLLRAGEKIAQLAMETAESLIRVDSDALLRPLCRLANKPLARSPLLPALPEQLRTIVTSTASQEETRAKALLLVAAELPEQVI